MVKNLPAMQETQVRSLGWEDPLEERMETHPSILVWRISWTEEHGGLLSMGYEESDTTEQLSFQNYAFTLCLCRKLLRSPRAEHVCLAVCF